MSIAPAVCSENRRRAALSIADADTARGHRIRGLLTELDDIDADRALAHRVEPGAWLVELRVEERDTWGRIAVELSA